MNIALVVHDLHEHGGHSLYTRILADELSQSHEVTVFANRCERPANARWKFQPVRAIRRNALSTVQSFPLGIRSLRSELAEFDIRHMQGYCGGDPNLVTAHICVAAYLDSLRDISIKTRTSLRLMAAAEAGFYRRYNGPVIAVSKKIAGELQNFYQVRGEISVVRHGVNTQRLNGVCDESDRGALREEIGIDADQTMALYVGDLTKAHTRLKALADAAPEVHFMIVTFSRQYRWNAANVHFRSTVTDPAQYYAAADAFVFPTTYDAFGMAVLEAMAAGLPVFSSDQAGASELIRPGKDGFVIPLDDWVDATAVGLRDRDSLRAIGGEAETTARRHDWSTVVRKVEQVYFKVAASESAAEGAGKSVILRESSASSASL
jgi:glycosyltransferase involved in cell wall biosynthesis